MIEIIIENTTLLLKYLPYNPVHWITEKFEKNDAVVINKVFHFLNEHIFNDEPIEADDSEVLFVIGNLIEGYWRIDRNILKVEYDINISSEYTITPKTFRSETGLSIFREIFKVIQENIWIGGDNPRAIDVAVFSTLIDRFPTDTEMSHYISARVSSVLKEYFTSTKDFEIRYEAYIQKKRQRHQSVNNTDGVKNELKTLYKENELEKYQDIYRVLSAMMEYPESYDEKEWQIKIIDMLFLLYPKYVCVIPNVQIKDVYSMTNRYLDYLFVDTNGNTDIVEIKKPFFNCILRKTTYRDNYIPMTELSGAIMQIEKYIFYMNKWGIAGEKSITEKYREIIPAEIDIHITNPKGIVIMGQSKDFDLVQMNDFEIIKRKYNNIIDILSYDDLLIRIKRLIGYFEEI